MHPGPAVNHFDLYRLSGAADLGRLQLGETLSAAVSLVEWAERLGAATPPERLDLRFMMLPDVRAQQPVQTCLVCSTAEGPGAPAYSTLAENYTLCADCTFCRLNAISRGAHAYHQICLVVLLSDIVGALSALC